MTFCKLIFSNTLRLKHLKPPVKSLILIPKSSHLAPDLETFIYRFIELYEMDLKILCIDSDKIDPLQNAEKYLGLSGRNILDLKGKRTTIVNCGDVDDIDGDNTINVSTRCQLSPSHEGMVPDVDQYW